MRPRELTQLPCRGQGPLAVLPGELFRLRRRQRLRLAPVEGLNDFDVRQANNERRPRVSGCSFSDGPLVEPFASGDSDEGRKVAAFGADIRCGRAHEGTE